MSAAMQSGRKGRRGGAAGRGGRAGRAGLGALAVAALVGVAGCSFLADLSSTGTTHRAAPGGTSAVAGSDGGSGDAAGSGGSLGAAGPSSMTMPSGGSATDVDATTGTGTGGSAVSATDEIVLEPTGSSGSGSPDCSATASWTTAAEERRLETSAPLGMVLEGTGGCFDSIRITLRDAGTQPPGYRVAYVDDVLADGSGRPVPLDGAGKLQVVVDAPAYDPATGEPTYTPEDPAHMVGVGGYRSIRQVAWAGSFEGQTTIGIGVVSRLPFRVQTGIDGEGCGYITIAIAHPSRPGA